MPAAARPRHAAPLAAPVSPAVRGGAAATAARARRRAGKRLDRPAHELDLADAGVEHVAEDRLRALVGHAAVAVRDGPEADAVDRGIGPAAVCASAARGPFANPAAGSAVSASLPISRLV